MSSRRIWSLLQASFRCQPVAAVAWCPGSRRTRGGCVSLLLAPVLLWGGTRETFNFNPDWRFIRADIPAAAQPDFDDSAWAPVSLPHTWNDTDTFDNFGPGGHSGEKAMWTGAAWYRKVFTLPVTASGQRVYLEFEGVRQVAEVFINGTKVTHNETGFIPFGADLTPHLRPGRNLVAVRADNRFDEHFEGDRPWHHPNWHPPHGGIYRNVRLHVVDPLHVTLPLHSSLGTEGVYAWTEALAAEQVDLRLTAEVRNHAAAPARFALRYTLTDADGVTVARGETPADLAAGSTAKIAGALTLRTPRLWQPDHPHLYDLRVAVVADGVERDHTVVPYAPRAFRWDRDTGFWINGRNVKLHGWGTKPTGAWAGLGAAVPDWLHDYTLRQMADAGGNMLRWGHAAGSATAQGMIDRLGLVTIMPGVDGERDCFGKAWATRKAAFRDTVIYFRNHPSVFIWEGGNYNISTEHTAELRQVLDEWDPHGRRYFGFRMSTPPMLPYIDIELGTIGRRRALPVLPVIETEYDRIEAPRRLWDMFSPPDFGRMGNNEEKNTYRSTQESFAINAVEEWWTKFGAHAWHSGGANWIFHDEPHGSRQVTDAARATGEVDGVRLPKEAYYVLQAMWRDEARVHLIGHWNYPENTTKPVHAVAQGAGSAELFVNGRSLGRGTRSHHHLFTWADVNFVPGEIKVVVYDEHGVAIAEQRKETAGDPVALRLTPITAPGGWRADGQDVALFDVEIVDAAGRRCPTVQQRVDFAVEGPGVWRGGYNSGREGSTNHLYLDTECGINRVSIRSTREAGVVRLTARSGSLQPATVEVSTQPFAAPGGLATVFPARYPVALPAAPVPVPADVAGTFARRFEPRRPLAGAAADTALLAAYAYTGDGIGDGEAPLEGATLAYTDNALHYLDEIPSVLRAPGTRILRTALKDTAYWANDYIVGSVARDITLYVAHDERVPVPAWLNEYSRLEEFVVVDGKKLRLHSRALAKNEPFRISGNADQTQGRAGTLNLILFAQPR
jgi:beta-galactosidase